MNHVQLKNNQEWQQSEQPNQTSKFIKTDKNCMRFSSVMRQHFINCKACVTWMTTISIATPIQTWYVGSRKHNLNNHFTDQFTKLYTSSLHSLAEWTKEQHTKPIVILTAMKVPSMKKRAGRAHSKLCRVHLSIISWEEASPTDIRVPDKEFSYATDKICTHFVLSVYIVTTNFANKHISFLTHFVHNSIKYQLNYKMKWIFFK